MKSERQSEILKIIKAGDVETQEQLLTISGVYTLIPAVTPSGYYDEATADAVEAFQGIFGLPKTGVTDFATWYKISQIYVGITRIGELNP